MRIDFQPISSVLDAEEVLAVVEIRTLFHAATYVADLEWDEDELLRSFIDGLEDQTAKQDYRAEPAAGIQEAKDLLLSQLYQAIEARHGGLGAHSPFKWDFANGLLLERRDAAGITSAGIGYLWLSFFWLLSSDKDYLVIEKEDRKAFIRKFSAVFEHICCFVMSSRTPSAVWYFGDSRDVLKFLRRLKRITKVCGSGVVKLPEQLEANQVGANDAGVDLIAIDLQDGSIRRDAMAYLVGATIQRSDRRHKMMSVNEATRFTNYFAQRPLLAYKGVLMIPFVAAEAEQQTCRDKDCLYVSKDEILFYLSRLPADPMNKFLRYPGAKMLKATRLLQDGFTMAGNDQDLAINWA